MSVSVGRAWRRRRTESRMLAVEKVCERVAAGACLAEVCRDPLLPQRWQVDYWRRVEPVVAQMLEQAEAASPAARRAYHPYDDEIAAEVLARVVAGRGLAEVCAEADMPAPASVYRWLDERPEFAERYRRAKAAQAERLFDLAWRIACETTGDPEAVRLARLQIQTLKWRVAKLAPRRYGALKPQPAEDEAEARKPGRLVIEARRWALSPDNRVLETTALERGLSRVDCWRLEKAVAAGRFTEGPDGKVATVDWRDFDCGPPPAWLAAQDAKDGGTHRDW